MKNHFFITGLPRSRTAWVSNYLTYGNSFCFHEGIGELRSICELPALLERPAAPVVGDSDTGLPFFWRRVAAMFPQAPWVVIRRRREDCEDSFRALKYPGNASSNFEVIEQCLDELTYTLKPMVVDFRYLDWYMEDICRHCVPGWVPDKLRHEQMMKLLIECNAKAVLDEMNASLNLPESNLKAEMEVVCR